MTLTKLVPVILVWQLCALAGCSTDEVDPPKVIAKKALCRKIIRHMFEVNPETKSANLDERMAKVPVEDIEQCAAADDQVLGCLGNAQDLAAVKACIPPPKKE